ncbi:MAG: hypothetical protein ACM3RX_00285 [Methanococcaceae archaeon]
MVKNTILISFLIFLSGNLIFPQSIGKKIPITGNTQQLNKFFNSLNESKSKKIRIAHYGDSIIWGDIITSDLREILQKKFGGQGAGFQSIVSDDIKVKMSTIHTFSNEWDWASLFTKNPNNYTLGIAGTVAKSGNNSWIQYAGNSKNPSTKSFKTVRLFYSNANNCQINYSFNNGSQQKINLENGSNIKETVINNSSDANIVKLNFSNCGNTNFFGASLENGNGIYVDNFPIRGNSGVSIADLQKNILNDFNKFLNYKLIILNFGMNIASAEQTNYTWYKIKMIKVINYLKETFPDASILLVSVGDKVIKKGTKFVTDPAIFKVLNEQKDIAKESGVAFWNMFEAMGGENSMPDWVNKNLALMDYSHFSEKGGKVIAEMLVEALMNSKN